MRQENLSAKISEFLNLAHCCPLRYVISLQIVDCRVGAAVHNLCLLRDFQQDAVRMLFEMSQCSCSVVVFTVEFHTAAIDSGWNATALYDVFYRGLTTEVNYELAGHDLLLELDELITLATHVASDITEVSVPESILNETAKSAKAWLTEIHEYARQDVVLMILGNKEFGVPFMETSARSGLNVDLAFTAIAKELKHRSMKGVDEPKFKLHEYVNKEMKTTGCCRT
ncbi:hypothetical protein QTP70_003712 [Hemibagrus guttatus]|uniref:Uncharacterized protein n=1 Tax=Hemibagrus guttatus TaxID=175788 RepID=A0AAE0UVW2_9TELE|nr:hypothetical protein QTP70_003712 [Hemibagrus guttatus]